MNVECNNCGFYIEVLELKKYTFDDGVDLNCYLLGVPGSVYRNIKLIERTNKIQPCSRIHCTNVS